MEAHCGNQALGINVFEGGAQLIAILPAPLMLSSISTVGIGRLEVEGLRVKGAGDCKM